MLYSVAQELNFLSVPQMYLRRNAIQCYITETFSRVTTSNTYVELFRGLAKTSTAILPFLNLSLRSKNSSPDLSCTCM